MNETGPVIRRAWTETGSPGEIFYIGTESGRDFRDSVRAGLPLHETLAEVLGRDSRSRDSRRDSRFRTPGGTGRVPLSVQQAGELIGRHYRDALHWLARH